MYTHTHTHTQADTYARARADASLAASVSVCALCFTDIRCVCVCVCVCVCRTGGPLTDNMQGLADELAAWMGTGAAVISGTKALPAVSVYKDRPAFNNTPPSVGMGPRGTSPAPI